jgi:small-conductance mechanosensitive channel
LQNAWELLSAKGHLLIPLLVFLGVLTAGWSIRRVLFQKLERLAARSSGKFDDMLVRVLRGPFLLWTAMLGLYLAVEFSPMTAHAVAVAGKALLVLWILSLTIVAAKLAGALVGRYGGGGGSALPVTTLTQSLVTFAVSMIGGLILLETLHISITPILTALGVGGLAVALALQETLSNVFAGVWISLAGQVRVGDYVKLETGQEGYVTDIGWRSTALRALQNNLIVIPNAKLAQAIVTNFHLPETRMSLSVPVSVGYESDPDEIERVLVEEALEGAKTIPGLLAEPEPFVRFIPGFGGSSLDFSLICQVTEFVDQYKAQHELRKRIFKRFRAEGINIPFPVQTVYLKR